MPDFVVIRSIRRPEPGLATFLQAQPGKLGKLRGPIPLQARRRSGTAMQGRPSVRDACASGGILGEAVAPAAQSSSSSALGNEADFITPEIQNLAVGLRNDPVKIFEFVRNYIQYECYYGSKKGAHLTLMEGSGNDFDQCALLMALLRAAGHTATYEYGPFSFSYDEFTDWWGLSTTPYSYLTDGQFITTYGLPAGSSAADVAKWRKRLAVYEYSRTAGYFYVEAYTLFGEEWFSIPFCSLKFNSGGTDYLVCPAFKGHDAVTGIDLLAATGYNRANLLSSAGGITGSPDYVRNLSESGIGTQLEAYTSNLLAAIRASHDSKTVLEITGGRVTAPQTFASFADIPEMYRDPFANDWCPPESWTAIPQSRMSKLEITAGDYNYSTESFTSTTYTHEITMPSLAGKKISLSFAGNSASVRLDEDLLGSSFTVSGADVDVRLTAKHDHYTVTYEDTNGTREASDFVVSEQGRNDGSFTAIYKKADNNAYTFAYSFGNPDKQLRKRQEKLDAYRRAGIAETDWRVLTEGMNIMGLTYYSQQHDMGQAAGNIYEIQSITHHLFGRASQEGSFYIDVGLYLTNHGSGDLDFDQASRFGGLTTLFSSAMEHGVLEQTQGTASQAVSTVRLVKTCNDLGKKVFRATSSTWNSVQGQLQGYTTAEKDDIGDRLNTSTDRALVPEDGDMTVGQWSGAGYAIEGDAIAIMRISGGLNGGYNTLANSTYDVPLIITEYRSQPAFEISNGPFYQTSYTPLTTAMLYSWDPIEMVSGAYVLEKTDLALGDNAPYGLKFDRQYHSNRRFDDSAGLGYGWTHSANIFATERSSTVAALGQANSYQAAPFLAALIAAKDLHTNHANAKEWATAALVVHWALEQMRYNAVSVTIGTRSIQFIKMPDGSYIAPPGMNLTLGKNGSGHYVLTERHGNVMTFNSDNRIQSIANPNGATQTFSYSSGKLSQLTDSHGRSLTFTWTGSNISSVSDGTGRSVSYAYSSGDLTSCTDVESKAWTYQYDAEHRMISLKDPLNRFIAENDYDGESRVTRQRSMGDATREWQYLYAGYVNTEINPQNGVTKYYHDEKGRSLGVENPLGNRSRIAYDGQDRTILQTTPKDEDVVRVFNADNNLVSETDPLEHSTLYFYDALLHLQKVTDKEGNDTTYTYTAAHQIETVTDPLGHVTSYTYYPNGLLETLTDAENKTTTTAYDSWGNVNKVTLHDGTFTTFTSNARGDVLTKTDAENRTTTNTWNKRRQLLTTTAPPVTGQPPATVTNTYDDAGHLASTQDPNSNVTLHTWNALGKSLTVTQPAIATGDNVVTTSYDTRDWVLQTGNSLGHVTALEHDAAQRQTALVDPLNRRTENTFDANDRLLESKDPLNRITKSVWNARGEMERATDGENKNTDFLFDKNGNRLQLTNRRGKVYTFQYDDANRMTSSSTPTGKTTATTYFDNNLVKTVQEPSGDTTTFTYNDRNLVHTKADPVATISYSYDDSGLPLTVTEGSDVITRVYDERARIKSYTNADGDTIQYLYDGNNNLTRITYPDGKQVNYTYNERNALKTVTDWSSRVTTYQYDRLGRLTGIVRPNGTVAAISLDAAGQPLSIRETAGGKLFCYLKFSYDAAGQVKTRFIAPLVPPAYQQPSITATYDDDNRLLTVNSSSVIHDNDGNMTFGPVSQTSGFLNLTYNSRNQLTQTGGVSYVYDAEGHRRSSTDSTGTTRYVCDPNTGLSKLLVKHAPNGNKTYYVYGRGLLYEVDEDDQTKSYHFDQVGSTVSRTNDAGKVIGRAEYTAYGTAAWKWGDMDTPFLYNGQTGIQTDSNGLLCMRARYYSPYLMRFLNADPIGFSGGSNWFAYADGNPISKTDPFGTIAETVWDVVNLGIGGYSFQDNIRKGNYGWATVDGLGLVYDGFATAVPFLPAGASAGLKAARAGETAKDAVAIGHDIARAADATHNAARSVDTTLSARRAGTEIHGQVSHQIDGKMWYFDSSYMRGGANGYTGRKPDLIGNEIWGDVTTVGQWGAHVRTYGDSFGQGIPILYQRGRGVVNSTRLRSGAGIGLATGQLSLDQWLNSSGK